MAPSLVTFQLLSLHSLAVRSWARPSPSPGCWFPSSVVENISSLRTVVKTTLCEEEEGEDQVPAPSRGSASQPAAQLSLAPRADQAGRGAGGSLRVPGGEPQEWSRLEAGTPKPTHSGDRKQAQVRLGWDHQWKTSFWAKRGPGPGPGVGVDSSFLPHGLPMPSLLHPSHADEFTPLPRGRARYRQTRGSQQNGGPAKWPSGLDRGFSRAQPGSLGLHNQGLALLGRPRASTASLRPPKELANLD